MSGYIKRMAAASIATAALIASTMVGASQATASTTTPGLKALGIAKNQIGKPYQWGAAGPYKFDCSGLMKYSFGKIGKSIPRVAQNQYNATRHISSSSRVPGDLVFFGTSSSRIVHVGIYAGNGMMIDANSGAYYGRKVTREPVKGWFSQHYKVYYGRFA